MADFVRALINGSEKAANIARIIKKEEDLFSLLVEEKKNSEKNKRFFQDFKTLADVLIQESLKHDLSSLYPEMENNIMGEESNVFTNALGETIMVQVKDKVETTAKLLEKVLDGNLNAARLLAEQVHSSVILSESEASHLPANLIESYSEVGVWIDPIDATNEYIAGDESSISTEEGEKIYDVGLPCVTVLIGAFNLRTGEPILGVINQPFWQYNTVTKSWQGRYFWGVATKNHYVSSITRYPMEKSKLQKKRVILSKSEDIQLVSSLKEHFDVIISAGAGYKLLCVALGLADVYLLTKSSTHFWDTCGPHSIIKSLGGNMVKFKPNMEAITASETDSHNKTFSASLPYELTYNVDQENTINSHFANIDGILAYRDINDAHLLLNNLKSMM